jgi:serine/threonine-protein kinase RsbW
MAAANTVRIVFGSDVRLVDAVHAASEKLASMAGFDEDDALNVGIAVREAVINAIVHGNKRDAKRKVDVLLTVKARSFEARIRDCGAGFDPQGTPDPTTGDNVLKTSGRGLLMIRAFVDQVRFKYREGRGLEVTLIKRRAAGHAPAMVMSSDRP